MNSEEQKAHDEQHHFQKITTGAYRLEQSAPPRGLPSYQSNSEVEVFKDCPECFKAGMTAGTTNVYCPDHHFYYFHVLHHEPIAWQLLENEEGKAFVERRKRYLGIKLNRVTLPWNHVSRKVRECGKQCAFT